jgi:hypothetical protein
MAINEFDIEKLASFDYIKKTCWIRLYWASEIYSYGFLLREMANYPYYLPLAIKSDHSGPNFNLLYTDSELLKETEYYLGHSHSKNVFYNKKFNSNRFITIISPLVYFRRKNKIVYNPKSVGTIAFPVHSDLNVNRVNYFEDYLLDLKKLDKKFHPITICLHQHDILNGNYKILANKGFEIVTAGNSHDKRFAERLYGLISNFKYITSNCPGTITLLAIEMKFPFFIYGNANIKPPLIPKDQLVINPIYNKLFDILKLQNNEVPEISDDLVFEIETMLGIHNSISQKELNKILYKSLILWVIKGNFFTWILNRLKLYLNKAH